MVEGNTDATVSQEEQVHVPPEEDRPEVRDVAIQVTWTQIDHSKRAHKPNASFSILVKAMEARMRYHARRYIELSPRGPQRCILVPALEEIRNGRCPVVIRRLIHSNLTFELWALSEIIPTISDELYRALSAHIHRNDSDESDESD